MLKIDLMKQISFTDWTKLHWKPTIVTTSRWSQLWNYT